MALPHEVPVVDRPDVSDPAYQRFIWARYLRGEAAHAKARKETVVLLSAEGAEQLADLLDPPPARKVK
jgi:hypothetical protein